MTRKNFLDFLLDDWFIYAHFFVFRPYLAQHLDQPSSKESKIFFLVIYLKLDVEG